MKLNPFANLPNPREVFAWGVYDLANQSFQLLINTLLFGIFVAEVLVVPDAAGGASGDRVWVTMIATSLILVVVLSPVLGALADVRAWKREMLLATGIVCSILTACLAFLQPGQIWIAGALYVTAALACGLGENFLASFLPEISTPKNIGFVSALGWTMSYVGALILLGITVGVVYGLGFDDETSSRVLFFFAGIWFLAGMIPAMLYLRERARPARTGGATAVAGALRRLIQSAKETRKHRTLARFFVIFFIYSMATQTMIYFLGLIGKALDFELPELLLFALVIAITAGIASAGTAKYQDSVGHRRTIMFFLAIWVVTAGAMALASLGSLPRWMVWTVSAGVGVGLGGIGTASRAFVGLLTPMDRAAEFFGLWGMVYKLSGVAGPLLFALVSTAAPLGDYGRAAGLLMLAGIFGFGLVMMSTIDDTPPDDASTLDQSEPSVEFVVGLLPSPTLPGNEPSKD